MVKYLFVVCVCLFFAGCESPSMNMQRSAARDAGDTGITAYLDNRDAHDVDEKKTRILEIVLEIENFIDSGEIGQLTVGAITKQVNKVVPTEYQDLSDTVLDYLSEYEVPTDKVPENIIKNIKAALKGIRTGVDEYKLEDRKEDK